MKSILFEISFFEAFFKVHYTRKYRLSYPIPLPTTIAGILGSILGLPRYEIRRYFEDIYLGARYVNGNIIFESATLLELSKSGYVGKSVERILILNEPTYIIAAAGNDKKIEEIENRLKKYNFTFLPFGGQNDFFIKDIKFLEEGEIKESNRVSGYFPKKLFIKTYGKFWILPVKYRADNKSNYTKEEFVFTEKEAEIKEKVLTVSEIPIYRLENFSYEIS